MSTEPVGWQQPKTNWQAADAVTPADLNRNEGNAAAIESGNRTVDPAQAPASNVGTLRQLVDWFANRIKAITGTVNWWDAPPTTLTAAKAHIDAQTNPHNTTAAQLGALVSIEGVSNPGGNVDLVPGGAITISGNDAANTITISETHSALQSNPHNTTAAQVGAIPTTGGAVTGTFQMALGGAERHYEFFDGAGTYGVYGNAGAMGMYDWKNARGVFAYNLSNNTFEVATPTFLHNGATVWTTGNLNPGAYVSKGGNQTVEKVNSFILPTDTRTWTATAWDGTFTDKPTHIDIKDVATLVAYIDISYNGNGDVLAYSCTAAGTTNTWNHTYSGTRWTGVS